MKFVKNFFLAILIMSFLSGFAFAAVPDKKEGELPYYLKNWETPKKNIKGDELEKWKVLRRMFFATDNCSFSKNSTIINGSETQIVKIEGKEIKFVFDNYIREGDKIAYYSPCGKIELTLHQFSLVKNDIISSYKTAVDIAWQAHQNLNPRVLENTAKLSKMTQAELQKRLKEQVGDSGVTYGELAMINEVTKQDFVINEFHLGVIEAWGLTWLNTKKVLYSPQARLYDYLNDEPLVIIHELIHANPKLQRMPVAWHFDAELAASFLQALGEKTDVMTFLRHGYLDDIRWASRVFFGFDSEKAFAEIVKFRWSENQSEIDEAAFRKYETKIKLMRTELRKFIFDVVLPEFYSNQLYWISVNGRFQDENAYFKILMALNYDPTLLDGHHRTMKWMDENSDKIKELSEEAWRETAKKNNKSEDEEFLGKIANLAEIMGITREQMNAVSEKYKQFGVKGIRNWFWNIFEAEPPAPSGGKK